jgi:hypothetical protein
MQRKEQGTERTQSGLLTGKEISDGIVRHGATFGWAWMGLKSFYTCAFGAMRVDGAVPMRLLDAG